MAAQTAKKPLDRFPVIRTKDVDEMRTTVSRFYGEVRLSVGRASRSFNGHGNHCQLNEIGISYTSYGAPVCESYPNFSVGYAVPIAIAGSGWGKTADEAVGVTERRTLIASPDMPIELHCGPGFEQMTALLDASAVKRKLAGLIGAEIHGSVDFDPIFDLENPVNGLWWRLLQFLIGEAESRQADLPVAALGEIEQALIVMFLKANRHSFSHLLDRRHRNAAPRQVRLAEEYIEAHWDQPIKVELLAQLTNVSGRTIFDSFRKSRGYSPMAFVKQVRLRHARQMLLCAESDTTVAKIAIRCGFGNLGNFARDYREAFGELPSHTLKSSCGSAAFASPSE